MDLSSDNIAKNRLKPYQYFPFHVVYVYLKVVLLLLRGYYMTIFISYPISTRVDDLKNIQTTKQKSIWI